MDTLFISSMLLLLLLSPTVYSGPNDVGGIRDSGCEAISDSGASLLAGPTGIVRGRRPPLGPISSGGPGQTN